MWATILELIKDFLAAIPILKDYFPPKTTEQKEEEDSASIQKEQDGFKKTGKPS